MFCPNCGLDEKQPNQFCRACGANLRSVMDAIGRPDNVTSAAASAREEIGRAMAAKIREMDTAKDLKRIAEDVLPEVEKFLESPAEKRLRRIRTGTIISCIGLGVAVAMSLVALSESIEKRQVEYLFLAGLGLVTFFIGAAFVINGYLHTVLKNSLDDKSSDAERQRQFDVATSDLSLPESRTEFVSAVEHTTQHLHEKQPVKH